MRYIYKLNFSVVNYRIPVSVFCKNDKCSKRLLNYFVFKYFCFEHTWWRLFPKRVVCTNFDIYFFLRNCFKNKIYTFFSSFQIFSLVTLGVLGVDTFFQFRKFREGQSRPAGSSTEGVTTTTHTTYETRTQY